ATPAGAQSGMSRALGIAYTDAEGRFSFRLPAGKYSLAFSDPGRADLEREIRFVAGTGDTADATMAVASAVQFDIRDENGMAIPCKAQFLAQEGTEPVNLGPAQRAHGCRDQYHSERGGFRVQIPPGSYRIVVTRGIEYSHLAKEVTLKPGETATFDGTLKRLVNTRGWVSADYHNHSTPSGDNTCGTDDRLINLAAENVEFAPTTEHNRLYDWRPHLERLGLNAFVQTVPGIELTGSAAHFNSFPFTPVPFTQDNGAPVWNKDPRITAITLRDWQGAEPDRWIQINHPDMVANFIDSSGNGQADGGFHGLATLIDGVETQNYSASDLLAGQPFRIGRDARTGRESVSVIREFIWLQLLNRGHRYAAMAVCDAHTVWGNGTGGWRMYMPSASDDPTKIDWRENSRAAKTGRSYLTSGPFLQVNSDDGTGPGGQTRTINGAVKLRIRVQCTDWIDIDRVQILVNGRAVPSLNFTRAKDAALFRGTVLKFDETVSVPLSEDAHLIVVACAENSDLSIGYGTSAQAKVKPFAYHNPIFVDVDGHGFAPNGDTLGWPLPAKIGVEEAKRLLKEHGLSTEPPPVKTDL
ncbi:MAG: CehA/McbA family metallohydrolase, partial [Chthoniobacteraceae bacterium]